MLWRTWFSTERSSPIAARVPRTLRQWAPRAPFLLVAFAAGAFSLSCGSGPGNDSPTGMSPATAAQDDDGGDLSASGKKSRVLLCHKGSDKWVSPEAVSGHLHHGDSLGSCSAPVTCPCFSADDIQAYATQCGGSPNPICTAGDPYSLFLGCNPGGGAPPGYEVYLSQSDGGYCERSDSLGNVFSQGGLSQDEYLACVDAINSTGFCQSSGARR